MSTPIRIITRPPEIAGGLDVRSALKDIRNCIADGEERYICIAAEFRHSFGLRRWIAGILRYAGIHTGGDGFKVEHSPDWLLEINDEDSLVGSAARRVHVLDLIIQELEKQ